MDEFGEMRRFRYATDDVEKKGQLFRLCVEKGLTRDDLMLIVTTLSVNFDTYRP